MRSAQDMDTTRSSATRQKRGENEQQSTGEKPVRLLRRSRSQQSFQLKQPHPESSDFSQETGKVNVHRPQSCSQPEVSQRTISPFQRPNTSFHVNSKETKPVLQRLGSESSLEFDYRKFRKGSAENRKRAGSLSSASGRRCFSRTSSSTSSIDTRPRSRAGSSTSWRITKGPGLVKLGGSFNRSMQDFMEVRDDDDTEEREKRLREKFRHAVRMVRIFSMFCIGIRRYAEQEKSAQYDLYCLRDMLPDNEDKPTPVQEKTLYFNKHMYSRNNTLHFPLWARWTCSLAPDERSESDINKLVTLLRGMKSFNKFSREAQKNVCRTMAYACYERRRIIVRQGHPGFCFYFIVSGKVSVTVTRRDFKTGVSVTSTVDVLEKNDSFGEIALMTEDAKRTATIICRERVEVLIVNRDTVMEYCPDVFQREFQEKYDTLKDHELFKTWNNADLRQICFESHIRELTHGKLVDPDSTRSDALHFVIRGKVDMLRRLDMTDLFRSDAAISLCESRPLPRPASAMPRPGKPKMEYVSVGSLYKGDAWDLQTIFQNPPTGPGNILVSAGVRLLKVPRSRVVQLSLRGEIDAFEKTFISRHGCPSNKEIYEKYLAEQTWLEYRQKVVQNVMDYKQDRFVAHVTCGAKGTSGWGAWPGQRKEKKPSRTRPKIPQITVKETV